MGQLAQACTRGPSSEWRRRRRRRSSGSGGTRRRGTHRSRRFFFHGPRRALQDLYEDWSAIYRNRIPPYLTLPLARSSQPPLCHTDCLPSLPPPPAPCPFSFLCPLTPLRRFYSVFLSSSSLVSSLCFSTISPSFLSEIFTIPCSTINYFDL